MRTRLVGASAVALSLLCVAPAAAHQSPPGCTTGALNPSVTGAETMKRNGDVVIFTPRYQNDAPMACDYTDVTMTIELPPADGTAGDGEIVPLVSGIDVPAGTGLTELPGVAYTVDFDEGVFRSPVKVNVSGTGHFSADDTVTAGSASTNVFISRPHVTLAVSPAPASGMAPLSVTYTYSATNDSPLDPGVGAVHPSVAGAEIDDDRCTPVTPTGGDTTPNGWIDPGETWTFTCTRVFGGGTFVDTATFSGASTRDGRPWPTATAQSSITATGPDVTVDVSHAGAFFRGESASYSIVARNSGNSPTTDPVSVVATVPAGLTATGLAGAGWSCVLATRTCTRGDAVAGATAYPPITLTVGVATGAPASVTTSAAVNGGGDTETANNTDADPTAIADRPPPSTPIDRAPVLSRLSLGVAKFRAAASGPSVAARRPPVGTEVSYSLSEPASVRFTVQRSATGRTVGGRCVKPKRSNRARRRCVRWTAVKGSFTDQGATGRNTFRFSGRLRGRKLAPGRYRLLARATDGTGLRSSPVRRSFGIAR